MDHKDTKVAVICSTYRDPQKPSLTRLYGIASLVDQVRNQNFDGDVKIVIVDDSAEPHPFIKGLGNSMGDDLIYLHTPLRESVSRDIKTKYPEAQKFYPTDSQLQSDPFWQKQLLKVAAWENFLPFDYEFAKTYNIDMVGQIRKERPTIGMKKNFGCQAYVDATGSAPDVFVYVDDDDLRSPDYIKTVVEGIKGHDFARMTKTYAHNVSPDPEHRAWSLIDLDIQQDINGNWYVPDEIMAGNLYKYQDGKVIERPFHDLYQRNLLLAWPIIGQDGALHNYTGAAWENAVEEFGGFFPTSFSEDIITNHMMHKLPSGFQAKKIETENVHFIRCSDGRNASDFWSTKMLDQQDVEPWCKDALSLLYTAQDSGLDYQAHQNILQTLGQKYACTGQFELDVYSDKTAKQAPRHMPKTLGTPKP